MEELSFDNSSSNKSEIISVKEFSTNIEEENYNNGDFLVD